VSGATYVIATTRIMEAPWLEWLVDILGGLAAFMLAWMMFPAVLGLISGFFLEDVAKVVEDRHHPDPGAVREPSLVEILAVAGRFTLLIIVVNLAVLPLYAIVIWLPPLNLALFTVVNGYLLGREFFELVSLRHRDPADTRQAWRRHRNRLWLAGMAIAALSAIPFVGLLMPLVATAFMVHIYQALRAVREA
jgi:uncharacterized protein involved in cysteine biosynthesis